MKPYAYAVDDDYFDNEESARSHASMHGGEVVALYMHTAPTEGARDASAQQDEREAVAKWDCCANCMRPKAEHTMVGKCPDPFTTIWHEWDYDFAPDAKKSASAPHVQADAAVHPDRLLAECVEALKRVTLFLADPRMSQWGGEFYGDLSDEVAALSAILAKVPAAKEGK